MSYIEEKVAERLWESIDDKGIKGRLYREDCDYLTRVFFEALEDFL